MSEGWLRCAVLKGMFSDEVAIVLTHGEGEKVSFFVPKDYVVGMAESQGKVKVRVYRQGNMAWAVLPTENQATIPIDESDLSPSPV